jgi:hypothetical protein
MRREPHENVATVLVDPGVLAELELLTMSMDLRLWAVRHAPIVVDGDRMAFQVRRRLVERQRGAWDHAADWVPVWIGFGPSWHRGDEPLPWSAHQAMWDLLARFDGAVLFQKRLGGVPRIQLPAGLDC